MPSQIVKDTKDEIIFVPLPYGPGNKNRRNVFMADGYGIGYGSKKQKWAGKYIDICLDVWYKADMDSRKSWPKQTLAMLDEMSKNQYVPGGTESPFGQTKYDFIGQVVWEGLQPATVLESWRPRFQAMIDDANRPPEKPEQLPFRKYDIDFENGDISAFKSFDAKKSSVKVSLVSDDRAIEGKSLLVQMDSARDGDYLYVISDPNKAGAVGWRNYMVSFEVKMLKDPPSPDTNISFEIYQNDKLLYGIAPKKIDGKDGVYKVTGVIRDVFRNGKFSLRIGAYKGADFVIDNISIRDVK